MTRPRITYIHNRFSQEQCTEDAELLEKALQNTKEGCIAELARQLEYHPHSIYKLRRDINSGKAVLSRPLRMALKLYVLEKIRSGERNVDIQIARRIRSARTKGRKRSKIIKRYKGRRPSRREILERREQKRNECIGSDDLPRFDGFEPV